jgi:glycogen debranching enzyme
LAATPAHDSDGSAGDHQPMASPSTAARGAGIRRLPPPRPRIIPATDLGGVAVLKQGNLYLLSDPFGDVQPDSRGLGLYHLDTRVLSCAALRVNGVRPTLLGGGAPADDEARLQLTCPARPEPGRTGSEDDLGVQDLAILRQRWIAGGLRERIEVTSFSDRSEEVVLDLLLDADAADIFEVRGRVRAERGRFRPTEVSDGSVLFAYDGLDGLLRRTEVTFDAAEVTAVEPRSDGDAMGSVRVRWRLPVEPAGSSSAEWRVSTDLRPIPGRGGHRAENIDQLAEAAGAVTGGPGPVSPPEGSGPGDRARNDGTARISSDGALLDLVLRRSGSDLRLLQNDGPRPGEHYLAAGIPWFTTLFGRDSLLTALEVLPIMPVVARETLTVLAAWQAAELDPERDMEPGKILHELRVGELARTGELPHRPYYGSVDATPLWLILLDETFRWTGDLELVRSLWPNALAALDWIDRYGDRDGDGFVEYQRGAPWGLVNQGWKDSRDPIRHRDGSTAEAPIALVEVQGYVYDALLRMADLADRLAADAGPPRPGSAPREGSGSPEVGLAARLRARARDLQARFESAFWMPDVGYYAVALDADKRQVGTITSNPGHGLWSGIVSPERVDAVVSRLMEPALDSGWGIRTFAAGQPGYNPVGYHTGSVWPHDNAVIAAGLKRVGRHEAAEHVASEMLEAAQCSPAFRLPELFCGFDRAGSQVPVPYPVACSPQAWSAATPLALLGATLGIRAEAGGATLELDRPHLPSWVGGVTIRDLPIGDSRLDLAFRHGRRRATTAEVLRQSGPAGVVIRV